MCSCVQTLTCIKFVEAARHLLDLQTRSPNAISPGEMFSQRPVPCCVVDVYERNKRFQILYFLLTDFIILIIINIRCYSWYFGQIFSVCQPFSSSSFQCSPRAVTIVKPKGENKNYAFVQQILITLKHFYRKQ